MTMASVQSTAGCKHTAHASIYKPTYLHTHPHTRPQDFAAACTPNAAAGNTPVSCYIKITGTCTDTSMSNKDWFDDSLFGDKVAATTADACLARKAAWEAACSGATVEMSYNGGEA